MELLFSTDQVRPNVRFQRWLEMLEEQRIPLHQERLDTGPFAAKLEIARLRNLTLVRASEGPLRSESTPNALRRRGEDGCVFAAFTLAGGLTVDQADRVAVQRPGDLVVIDHSPHVLTTSAGSQCLYLKLPRARLESVLGPARHFAALTVGAELASTTVAMRFFQELIAVHDRLDPVAATRMASIGADLIVASIADRMAQAVPLPLSGAVTVQRAKAHIETHLSNPALDPPRLAAAISVPLRRLEDLFHERGQHISDWIWQRRLEVAVERLVDPGCAHLTIDTVARGCGFPSRAHLSRRFKDRFGLAPSEYRQAAGLGS